MILSPRVDEALRAISWPTLGAFTPMAEGDVLVTSAGFEDRSLAFLERSVRAGSRRFRTIGIDYFPILQENRAKDFVALAAEGDAAASLLTYTRPEPESSERVLDGTAGGGRLLLDISGMSRLLIVQLVSAIVRNGMLSRAEIVYTEAQVYPPSKEEVETLLARAEDYLGVLNFISTGIFGITIVPELSTVAMQGQPIRLVAFPSFNPTQFAAVCAEIQASFLTVVNGCPPNPELAWRRDAIRELNKIDSLREKEEVDLSTFDYRDTLSFVLQLYSSHGASQKLVIAPTGSKMQSVAIGLACGFLGDLQIVYPTPRTFPSPSNYTRGVGVTYRLPLSEFSQVASSTRTVSPTE